MQYSTFVDVRSTEADRSRVIAVVKSRGPTKAGSVVVKLSDTGSNDQPIRCHMNGLSLPALFYAGCSMARTLCLRQNAIAGSVGLCKGSRMCHGFHYTTPSCGMQDDGLMETTYEFGLVA